MHGRRRTPLRPACTACSQKANQVIGWVVGWDSSLAALTPCECINGAVPVVSPGNVQPPGLGKPCALSLSLSLSLNNLKGPHKNVNGFTDECGLPGRMVDLVILHLLLGTTASILMERCRGQELLYAPASSATSAARICAAL